METMSVTKAVNLHNRGLMTEAEVKAATGYERISEIAMVYYEECENLEIAGMHWTAEEIELEELTTLAYDLYQPLLAEEPEYLSSIVKQLKEKKQQERAKVASAFSARLKALRGENVLPFRRPF